MAGGGVLVTVAIVVVWRRRDHRHHRRPAGRAGRGGALERLLGPELSAGDLAGREYWGDLQYVGVVLLPPAYLAFVLQCSGHTAGRGGPARPWPSSPWPCCSCWPPAPPTTWSASARRGLDRHRPGGRGRAAVLAPPDLQHRPRLGGRRLLVVTLSRMSGLYRRQSALLVAAILLPILLNLLFNLRVGPFRRST